MREKKILKKIKEVVKKPIERRRKRKEKIELFDYLKKIEEEYKIFIKDIYLRVYIRQLLFYFNKNVRPCLETINNLSLLLNCVVTNN